MNVFLRIGVPAFFSVCALFLLGEAAWRSAARLNLLNSRFVFRTEPAITGRTLFAFVLLIMLAALSRRFLIP